MRLEILFQFIVPLTFLAIWALTSLLNRDTQPLPQRPMRPGARPEPGLGGLAGPGQGQGLPGNRRVATGERGQAEAAARGPSPRDATVRPAAVAPGAEPRAATALDDANVYVMDDEVVFVDPVTNRRIMSAPLRGAATRAAGKPQRPQQPRKPGRGRRAEPAGREVQPEPETRRELSDQVSRSMSQSLSRTLEMTPLSSKLTPLSASMASSAPAGDLGLERKTSASSLQARDVKAMLASAPRLRETIILAEVLQPPIALRRRPRVG
jgi:hypothetical protein